MESKNRGWTNWLAAVGSCVFTFLLIGDATAVEPRLYQLENGGAIAPHLRIEFGHDDNPLRGDAGSEGSAFVTVKPTVQYILQRRNNTLTIGYQGDFLQYFDEFCSEPVRTFGLANIVERPGDCSSSASPTFDKASYQDHELGLTGFLEINRRSRLSVDASTSLINQPLGTGLSANDTVLSALNEPDSFVRNRARAELSYGAQRARGELRFALDFRSRGFRENAGRDLEDLDERFFEPSASLLYRVGTRTQVFAGLGFGDISGGNSERTISRGFVGLEFDASAITSGSVQLNFVTEDFDDPEPDGSEREDLSFTGFDVDLVWRPRRFSTVTIGAGRETERATVSEEVTITSDADVRWVHFWRDRLSSIVDLRIERNEATDNPLDDDANDRTTALRLEGNYNVRRWIDLGAFVQTENRSGRNVGGSSRDFSRTLFGLTANGTF